MVLTLVTVGVLVSVRYVVGVVVLVTVDVESCRYWVEVITRPVEVSVMAGGVTVIVVVGGGSVEVTDGPGGK
jgi:hypothetical protein